MKQDNAGEDMWRQVQTVNQKFTQNADTRCRWQASYVCVVFDTVRGCTSTIGLFKGRGGGLLALCPLPLTHPIVSDQVPHPVYGDSHFAFTKLNIYKQSRLRCGNSSICVEYVIVYLLKKCPYILNQCNNVIWVSYDFVDLRVISSLEYVLFKER